MFKSHESQRCTDRFGRWVLPLLATLHKQLTQTVAMIGTKRVSAQILALMLTTSNLTRDNYQQTRLFIDSIFASNSVFCWPLGKYFLKKKHRPFTGYFPDLSASKRSKQNKQLSLHRIDFSLYENVKSLCIVNLYLSLPPPRPDSHSHISPSGG